jgi:hypothetical protein
MITSQKYTSICSNGQEQEAQELILGPCRSTKVRLLSFNRIHLRIVTGHNTLCRHLHLMGLTDSPLYRKCGAEDETSANILFRCETLASLRHSYLGSFFLEPGDTMCISLGAIWGFSKAADSLEWLLGHKEPVI